MFRINSWLKFFDEKQVAIIESVQDYQGIDEYNIIIAKMAELLNRLGAELTADNWDEEIVANVRVVFGLDDE